MDFNNRLITAEFREALKDYPLYSQDNKKKDAICVAVFRLGKIRWYILEGEKNSDDFRLYGIVVGLYETEYGYNSANEMADVSVNIDEYGIHGMQIEQDKQFKPCALSEIQDDELQQFLTKLYG